MKKYECAARGLTAFGIALSLGLSVAGFGAGTANAESRGTGDDATSLTVASRTTAARTAAAKTAAKVSVSKGESTKSWGFSGSAATRNITISAVPAAGASRGSSRVGDDASLPVGRGSTASRTTTEKAAGFTGTPYQNAVAKHARAAGVPVALALAVVRVESNYNPRARGSAGEVGLMQIKPRTARGLGFTGSTAALYDPDTNLRWGMKYLAGAYKLAGGDTCGTIMRYQGGHYARSMSRVAVGYCSKVKRHMAGQWT